MPSGELVGMTLKLTTGQEVMDGHSHFPTEMRIQVAAEDDAVHESHVTSRLALNFDRWALRHVHAHWIDKRMGQDKLLDSAAPRCEALLAKILQEEQCLQHDHECVDSGCSARVGGAKTLKLFHF